MHELRLNLAVVGGCIAHLAIGGSYVVSILLVYVISYYRLQGEDTLTLQDGTWIGPGLAAVSGIFGYLAAKLPSYLSSRSLLIIGNGICILSMFLASIAPTFRLFLLCNLLYGLGVPITAMVTIAMLWSHFPAHKGLIVGFLLSALVMSSSISSFLMPMLVNPRNLDPDIVIYNGVVSNHLYSEQIAMRLPFTMRGLAFLYLFYTIIAIPLFIPLKPSESEFRSTFEENKCGTLRTGLTHRIFICMYSIGFLSTSYGLYMSSVYKNFGQEEISDDKFFTWVNIMNSISSASFRVLCAALSDKFGFHRVFPWILCVQLILGYTYYFSRSSQVLFLLANALSMGCEGGVISTLVGLCGETFGKMMGVKVYSILYTSFITSLLFSIALQAVVLSKIGYFYMFLIVTSLNWISLGLLRVMPKECPWRAEHKEVLIEFPNREDN